MLGRKDSKVCLFGTVSPSACVGMCVCVSLCLCLTVRCPRAAMVSASVWDTLSMLPLFLCLRFLGARHSNHILCWLTTPPSPWLLAKLLPRWPPDALELLGSKLWTSHPSNDTVFRNSASPPSMLEGQRQRHKDVVRETAQREHKGGLKIIACMIKYALHCLFQVCWWYERISITAHAQTHELSIIDIEAHLKEYATHGPSATGKSQSSAHSSQRGEPKVCCDAWAWPGDKTLEQLSWGWTGEESSHEMVWEEVWEQS